MLRAPFQNRIDKRVGRRSGDVAERGLSSGNAETPGALTQTLVQTSSLTSLAAFMRTDFIETYSLDS